MRTLALIALTGACALAACSEPQPSARQAEAPPAAPQGAAQFDAQLPMREFMIHVMQYTADGIWDRQGAITDETGTRSLFPKNDAEWEAAEGAALTLVEVSNALLIPGRRVAEPQWDRSVDQVRTIAREAAAAAERKDKDAFFKAGGALDQACESCHTLYDPNAEQY